jgi:hypothetical protein
LKGRRSGLILLAAGALIALPASLASAQVSYPGVPWTELLPPLPSPTEPQPGPVRNCPKATLECIDIEIRRMRRAQKRFGCDHRAVFATTYLTLTKTLKRMLVEGALDLDDPKYLYTEDAVFANVYFRTIRAWNRGDPVPAAWRIAFQAAAARNYFGAQDMLLGINAHVQNDMPFVIASLGLRTPAGESRKPDHDEINKVLSRAYQPVVNAVKSRYDRSLDVTNPAQVPIDDIAGLEAVRAWRELVWRNAERLVNAKTAAERANAARSIEATAALTAQLIAAVRVPGYGATRDAYCREQLGLPAGG